MTAVEAALAGQWSTTSGPSGCEPMSSNITWKACQFAVLEATDARRRQILVATEAAFASSASEIFGSTAIPVDPAHELQAADEMFVSYREQQCKATNTLGVTGSGYTGYESQCEIVLTRDHIEFLEASLAGG